MSFWMPLRWGALEALRSVWWERLAVVAELGLAVLVECGLRPDWFWADAFALLVTLVGPGLVLGGAPPSGRAMPRRADRAWASLCGGLVHAALAAGVTAALLSAAIMVRDRRFSTDAALLKLACTFGAVGAVMSLLASALRLLLPRLELLTGLLSLVALAALGSLANAFWDTPKPMGGEWVILPNLAMMLAVGLAVRALASFVRPPAPKADS